MPGPNPLYVDIYEPDEIYYGLKATIPWTEQQAINSAGMADYQWVDLDGNRRQWERKQVMEAVSDLDSVEEQLNRELATCEELVLVVEGIGLPTPRGIQGYKVYGEKLVRDYHFPNNQMRPQPGLYAKYMAWKEGLRFAGVKVVETTTMAETIAALHTAYTHSQRPEHTTLRRYLTPHIPPFSPNRHVDNLARLKNTGIGLVKAQAMIQECHTLYGSITAIKEFQDQILGKATGKKFREVIGRP